MLLNRKRSIVQWVSLVVLNSRFLNIGTERFCIPVMNCEACALAWLGCPIGTMGSSIGFLEFPWLVLIFVGGAGILFGRFLCGWVCPMGLLQDVLHKIPSPKFKIPGFLTWLKYGFLLITVVWVAYEFGKKSGFFFCSFCPTSTLQVVIPGLIGGPQQTEFGGGLIVRFVVLGMVLIFAVGNHRIFCKVMCPIGALVALTNKVSLFSLRLNADTCVSCTKCNKVCPMDVKVMETKEKKGGVSRDTECIECLTCEQACPVTAISNNSRVLAK